MSSNKVGDNRRRRQQRLDILQYLGGICVRCGFSDWRALQIDHVNGGGAKHYKEIGGSPKKLYDAVRANPELYQLLCANCNWIKLYENNESKGAPWKKSSK